MPGDTVQLGTWLTVPTRRPAARMEFCALVSSKVSTEGTTAVVLQRRSA